MKIYSVRNCNVLRNNLTFKAGVTNLYSDFDGTFMPNEFNHDTICGDDIGKKARFDFVHKGGKIKFKKYFDNFIDFIKKAKGENGDKFNFTITSGRNRPEYNYYIKRIREQNLKVPIPEKLVVRDGAEAYIKRKDVKNFFESDVDEVFLSSDFDQAKRDAVKKMSGGWDGEKFEKAIRNVLDEIKVDGEKITVFDVATDGSSYDFGMNIRDSLQIMTPTPANYAAIKDNGTLKFQIFFPQNMGGKDALRNYQKRIERKLSKDGIHIYSKMYGPNCKIRQHKLDELTFAPMIDGHQINKLFDTKVDAQRIMKNGLNDLVIAAGDHINDVRMLNLFNYVGESDGLEVYDAKTLKQIYDLPVISIFVDNISNDIKNGNKINATFMPRTNKHLLSEMDNYFNSDGNVRFIHVLPGNDVGKPQTLQEGVQLAIREYAKRNEEFRKNLPKEMQDIIENMTYEYPIDRTVSKQLEAKAGVQLWNPAPALKKINKISNFKKYGAIAFTIGAVLAFYAFLIKKIKQNGSVSVNAQNSAMDLKLSSIKFN